MGGKEPPAGRPGYTPSSRGPLRLTRISPSPAGPSRIVTRSPPLRLRDDLPRGPVADIAIALGFVAACCLVRGLADPFLGDSLPTLPAAVAGILAARWLGLGPGVVALVAGLVVSDCLFARPRVSWSESLVRDASTLVVSGVVGGLVVWSIARLRSQAVVLAREIADRQRAEAEREMSRRQFEQFLHAAPFCAYLKDGAGRFVFVNRCLQEAYPEVVAGSTVNGLFPEAEAEQFSDNDRQVMETGLHVACEELATSADGTERHWSTVKFPVADAEGRRGVGGVSMEITDRKQAVDQAVRSEALLRRLIDVQEREKQQLCHEFHDGLMQCAIAARMVLEAWRDGHPGAEAAAIDEAIGCLGDGIADGRRAIRGIRPAVLDDLGLKAAVEEFAAASVGVGPVIAATVDPAVDRVSPTLQTTAFRIVQEATANARRHSGTDRLRIGVRITGDDLLVEVEDVGRGFDPAKVPRSGFGIVGMLQRARLVGGECRIDSEPGRGTTVTARLPARDGGGAGFDPAVCPM